MNKLYQRINWQNYPSDSTPLNESNLNKMDAAVDGIDDRVVTLDTTKLPVATAYTMVKDVAFDEKTGVFTITKLNGTKVTVNTALEKIATNFRFDHSTQKLILTLIDGTTQEVDLSALLTQYEFLNSSTIQFTIDSSGKVKASVVNGSITGDMLEPNYLANVTLQASKADTSAKNAKESEEKAAEYAENAKNSADSAEPVASTATGKNPTIQDSTNAPFIYGKFKGYTSQDGEPTPDNPIEINGLAKDGAIEVKTIGKNLLKNIATTKTINGVTFTVNDDKSITANGTATAEVMIGVGNFKPKPNKTYIFTSNSKTLSNSEYWRVYSYIANIDGVNTWRSDSPSNNYSYEFTPLTDTTIYNNIYIESGMTVNNLKFYPMIRPVEITDDTYEPYTETTAIIPTDPLYEGDYLEIFADGSGKLVRKMGSVVLDGSSDETIGKNDSGNLNDYTYIIKLPHKKTGCVCNRLKHQNLNNIMGTGKNSIDNVGINATGDSHYLFVNVGYYLSENTISAFKTWLAENPITIVYELAEPTETPLTAEQVAQFKKLYTFEPVTNVLCDGEVEMLYLKNTDGGRALASVRRGVEHADTATTATKATQDGNGNAIAETYAKQTDLKKVIDGTTTVAKATSATTATKATQDGNGNAIAETYYRKTNFDKIVGGTVEPSGKTNVQYSVPTDVSSKGVVVQTNTSGTLINALSKATASISGFFSILYNAVKTRYLGRIDLGMYAIQNTYDFTSFAGYDRYTFVFKGKDANRSLYTRELLTIHNIEKNTSNVGKACLNIPNNYTFEPWVEMYQSGDKTYIAVQLTDTTGLTTLVSGLYVEVYGAMD